MKYTFLVAGALMAATTFSSCAAGKKHKAKTTVSTNANELKQKWMIKEIRGGNAAMLLEKQAYISFNEKDMRGSANFGCNGMGFDYSIPKAGTIKFGPVMSTMMFCEGITQIENIFSQEAKGEMSYQIEGHFLYIKDSKGVFIKAVRPDWD